MREHCRILLFDLSITGHHGFYVSCIARHLCSHNHEVHFMTLAENDPLDISRELPNFKQISVNKHKPFLLGQNLFKNIGQMFGLFRRCMQYANVWQADIIHILYLDHNILPLFFLDLMKRSQKRYQIVGTLFWPFFAEEIASSQTVIKQIYRYINRICLNKLLNDRFLSALFLYSSINRQHTIESLKLAPPSQGRIIHLLDPAVMSYDLCSRAEARKRLDLPLNANIVMFFGVLTRDKGFDILIEAMRNYQKDFTLLIAGRAVDFDPAFLANLKQQSDFAIEVIARIGHIPEEEVPYYFMSADAILLPYKKHYILTSGVLQQSCGAGKPVIVSDVGEIGEAVRSHGLGILVQPESVSSLRNGIEQYLEMDEQTRDKLTQNTLNYARKYDWRKSSKEIEDVYLNIIHGNLS